MSGRSSGSADSAYWLGVADRPVFDWAELATRLPFATGMAACLQDPIHHAEGDVWTHTRMVVEALIARRSALSLAPDRWPGLLLAALLHDIAKPATRTESVDENGRTRVHHHGHARRGAQMAWTFLWREGVPRAIREQVHHLIAWHQRPFHLGLSRQLEPRAIAFSQIGVWRELIAHAGADMRGRISADADETAMRLELLSEEIGSRDLLDRPWPFASDHARIWHGLKSGRSPHYDPPPPKGSRVIVLSGLPGAGKDTYCRSALAGWPQVSLDALREELDVAPEDRQGRVVHQAIEAARRHLRAKERSSGTRPTYRAPCATASSASPSSTMLLSRSTRSIRRLRNCSRRTDPVTASCPHRRREAHPQMGTAERAGGTSGGVGRRGQLTSRRQRPPLSRRHQNRMRPRAS